MSIKYIIITNLFVASQLLGWTGRVTNWSDREQDITISYAGCKDDRIRIGIGDTAEFYAKGCLVTKIMANNVDGTPYESSGQRAYTDFLVIGPVEGKYMVGRAE